MSRQQGGTRFRAAVALTLAGVLLTVGIGTALIVGASASVRQYEALAAVPGDVRSDESLPREPREPAEQPTPTAAPDGARYDQWGVRLYGDADSAAVIDYPAALTGDELEHLRSWVDMQFLVAECMTESGHDYTFQLPWERSPESHGSGLPEAGGAAWIALYGDDADGPYDWTRAGCHGAVVHAMGNDGAH